MIMLQPGFRWKRAFCLSGSISTGVVGAMSGSLGILLQKSKVASVRIFGETLKREAIDDSDSLSRVTEVAHEFSLRRRGPSDIYTKTAPAALRKFDAFCKTTFATVSSELRTSMLVRLCQQRTHATQIFDEARCKPWW